MSKARFLPFDWLLISILNVLLNKQKLYTSFKSERPLEIVGTRIIKLFSNLFRKIKLFLMFPISQTIHFKHGIPGKTNSFLFERFLQLCPPAFPINESFYLQNNKIPNYRLKYGMMT